MADAAGKAGTRKVVILDIYDDLTIEREILAPHGVTLQYVSPKAPAAEVLAALREADAVLLGLYPIRDETLAEMKRCRIIARYGIGTDNIDLDAARARGIIVSNVPDFCIDEVAAHAMALTLALVRRVVAGDRQVQAGNWNFMALGKVERLSALRFGIVGYGQIGRRVAGMAKALGFQVAASRARAGSGEEDGVEIKTLPDLLSWADIVSIHAPSTPATRGLIGATELAQMKPGAYLVNTGRGALVDSAALSAALKEGQIAGAALDVFETEPPPASWVAATPNLIATPHMAFYSESATREARTKASRQVALAFEGKPLDYPIVVP